MQWCRTREAARQTKQFDFAPARQRLVGEFDVVVAARLGRRDIEVAGRRIRQSAAGRRSEVHVGRGRRADARGQSAAGAPAARQ